MKIERIDHIFDGGSIVVRADVGSFTIDRRIRTSNYGRVYAGAVYDSYPPSCMVSADVVKELGYALAVYSTDCTNPAFVQSLIRDILTA
jgi:hypothetical protein